MMNYAIVGGGRLARHFSNYFQLLEIPHTRWTRDGGSPFNTSEQPDAEQRLRETVGKADRAFVACYKKENGQNKLWEQAS